MLKISCRMSIFLKNGIFAPNFFLRQDPKMSCHIIHTVKYSSNKTKKFYIVNENRITSSIMTFGHGKLKIIKRNPGEAAGTVKN